MCLPLAALLTLALAHPGIVSQASAHPTPDIIGQRLDVRVTHVAQGDAALQVDVLYTAEVPERRVLAEAMAQGASKDFATRRLAELATGLKATWDGQPLRLESVPLEHAARNGEPGFLELRLDLRAPLPSTSGTLHLQNGNYPDETCYFATQVTLPGDQVVTATTLASVRDGVLADSTHAAWNSKDQAREFEMSVRPAGTWEVREGQLPLPERMAGLDALSTPRWVIGSGVALAAGAAAVAGRAALHRRRAS